MPPIPLELLADDLVLGIHSASERSNLKKGVNTYIYIGIDYLSPWVRNSYSSPTSILSSMHRNFTFRKFCVILDMKREHNKTYNGRKKYFMLRKITNVKI